MTRRRFCPPARCEHTPAPSHSMLSRAGAANSPPSSASSHFHYAQESAHAFGASPPGGMEERARGAAVTHEDNTERGGKTRAPGVSLASEITSIRFCACVTSLCAPPVMSLFASCSCQSRDRGGVWVGPFKSSRPPLVNYF